MKTTTHDWLEFEAPRGEGESKKEYRNFPPGCTPDNVSWPFGTTRCRHMHRIDKHQNGTRTLGCVTVIWETEK
jgi:hypothetical protein